MYKDDPEVLRYMKDMESMHKVTLMVRKFYIVILTLNFFQVKDEPSLKSEAEKLVKAGIDHKMWIEDGMAVCLAVKPQQKERIRPLLSNLPLYK
jgi:hypothetical protein